MPSAKDAESLIREFNQYSFGTKYNLRVNLADSAEERERKKLRIKEDEEFYEKLYQEYSANQQESECGLRLVLFVAFVLPSLKGER